MYGEELSVSLYDDGKGSEKGLLLTSLCAFASLLDFAKGSYNVVIKVRANQELWPLASRASQELQQQAGASPCLQLIQVITRASQEIQLQAGCFLLAIASSIHKEAE